MANSYGTNPIYLDTDAAAVDVGLSVFGNSKTLFFIENIEWQNPTTAGDTAELTNAAGIPIFSQTCPVNGQGVDKDFGGAGIKGLKMAANALDSGALAITLSTR